MQDEVFEVDVQIKPLVKGSLRLPSIVLSIIHNSRDIKNNKTDKKKANTSNQQNAQDLSNQKNKINSNNNYKVRLDEHWVYNESLNQVVNVVALTDMQVYHVPNYLELLEQNIQRVSA